MSLFQTYLLGRRPKHGRVYKISWRIWAVWQETCWERLLSGVSPVWAKEATRVTDRALAGNTFIESSDKSRFLPTLDRKHFYGNIVWRTVCMKNTDHGWAKVMRSLYIVKECEVHWFSRDLQWTAATWGAGLEQELIHMWHQLSYCCCYCCCLLEEKKRKHVVVLFSNSEHYHWRKLRCICKQGGQTVAMKNVHVLWDLEKQTYFIGLFDIHKWASAVGQQHM